MKNPSMLQFSSELQLGEVVFVQLNKLQPYRRCKQKTIALLQ